MATREHFHLYASNNVEAYLEFNDANLRVGAFIVSVPLGSSAYVWVTENGNQVWAQTFGPGLWQQNIPGNHRMIETINSQGEPEYSLPPVQWAIEVP